MYSLRLALSLIRVPKLFATLFLMPLLLSLLLVAAQLFVTAVFLQSRDDSQKAAEERFQARRDFNIARKLLYGDAKPLPAVRVCRWTVSRGESGKWREDPPSEACRPKRLDVALVVPNPEQFNTQEYERILNGNVETLHVCRGCKPDIIIHQVAPGTDQMRVDVLSVWGLIILNLVKFDGTLQERYLDVAQDAEKIDGLLGDIYFNASGLKNASKISNSEKALALIFNVASLTMIALWLAIKAHRRVLDYFSKNGALLPMVAACGKSSFYRALWLLTLFRVAAFLLATVPATAYVFTSLFDDVSAAGFLDGVRMVDLLLWITAIFSSFAMATIIASLADLKQRHSIFSMLYVYTPFILASLGALVWALTFFGEGAAYGYTRNLLTSLPIVGMAPTILAPKLQPQNWTLLLQALLSLGVVSILLRRNTRWFAAHLEEL